MSTARPRPDGDFLREVLIDRSRLVRHKTQLTGYPWTLPVVAQLMRTQDRRGRGLELAPGVTFLVGDNGTGKSTLLEALAVATGMNPEGGSRDTSFATRSTDSPLGRYLTLVHGRGVERTTFFLRAESLYNVATVVERLQAELPQGWQSFGDVPLHGQSHGELFLALLRHRCTPGGLYLLDEPESALSPRGLLTAIALLHATVQQGSQCVIATHSPVLLALPGARILQIDAQGLVEQVSYDQCAPVVQTRRFLRDPAAGLAELLDVDPQDTQRG